MERLWAPWRSTYVKEKRDPEVCIFCAAAQADADRDTLVVYRGQHNFVLLNRYPYTSGHLMIAPYEHVSRLSQIDSAAAAEMMDLAKQAEEAIQGAYHPDGFNIGMNLGQAAGAGIEEHIHLHVLPRWMGDANFMTTVGNTRVLPEDLKTSLEKIKGKFER